jgi:hypothetical protein
LCAAFPSEASKDVFMAQSPRGRTPAERAEEFTAVQRRLKSEAAERRKLSEQNGTKRPAMGLSQQTGLSGRHATRPRTP